MSKSKKTAKGAKTNFNLYSWLTTQEKWRTFVMEKHINILQLILEPSWLSGSKGTSYHLNHK